MPFQLIISATDDFCRWLRFVTSLQRPTVMRTLCWTALLWNAASAQAETLVWNVQQKFGVSAAGLQQGIDQAKAHFAMAPDDIVVLEIDRGRFELKSESDKQGTLDLTEVMPGESGRLIIRGQGMDQTTLVFHDDKHALFGWDVNRVTISDLHMTRDRLTISQGIVQSVGRGVVRLKLDKGYPTPEQLYDATSEVGRYLRRYRMVDGQPQIDLENNQQLAWQTATNLGNGVWEMQLSRASLTPAYEVGDLLAIKSKRGGYAFWIARGQDLRFERVKWTLKTRGKIRKGFQKVEVIDCVTERTQVNGQWPCLASPEGGPQIGHPGDGVHGDVLISGGRFIGSGDDAIGLFEVSGRVQNCVIEDAFARGIFLFNCANVTIQGVDLIRSPIVTTSNVNTGAPQ